MDTGGGLNGPAAMARRLKPRTVPNVVIGAADRHRENRDAVCTATPAVENE